MNGARLEASVLGPPTVRRELSVAARLRSVAHAGQGILTMLASQHNAWIHAAATVVVVCAGIAVQLGRFEWLALVFAIVTVWAAEALNTAFEFLCDVASPEFHPLVKRAKDVAAGAVLICALGAVATGAFVFAPHMAKLGAYV
jgi:diacylglycerol kinase (ATP)